MAKLYFKHGAMGGGKTLDCIRTYYNYKERNLKPLCFKSAIDNRDSKKEIVSRTGDRIDCSLIYYNSNIEELFKEISKENTDVIIIDESQFLNRTQVNELKDLVEQKEIPVICYGLKVDFQSNLFEGSKRLVEIGDKLDEIKSICWCGKKASHNAKVINNKVVYSGDVIDIGGNEKYVPLCYTHYKNGIIEKRKD